MSFLLILPSFAFLLTIVFWLLPRLLRCLLSVCHPIVEKKICFVTLSYFICFSSLLSFLRKEYLCFRPRLFYASWILIFLYKFTQPHHYSFHILSLPSSVCFVLLEPWLQTEATLNPFLIFESPESGRLYHLKPQTMWQ